MHLDPEHAHTLLLRVDPGRLRSGRAVGLRDGAVLSLVAAGLSTVQIAALPASVVTMEEHHAVITIPRHGTIWRLVLPTHLGAWMIAWLTEAKLWGSPEPLFRGCRGPLTPMGIWKIINRYRSLEPPAARQKAA